MLELPGNGNASNVWMVALKAQIVRSKVRAWVCPALHAFWASVVQVERRDV